CAHKVVAFSRTFAEPGCRRKQQGHREQTKKRELDVRPQHDRDDRHDLHQVTEKISDTGCEQFIQGVDVTRQSRHDPAHRIAIVVSDFLMLQLRVEFFPHVEHHVLPGTVEENRLKIGEDESQQLRAQEKHDKQCQAIKLAWENVVVDCVLGKLWLQYFEQIQPQSERESHIQVTHVRLQITQQPPRHLKVIRLSNRFFFVKLFYRSRHQFNPLTIRVHPWSNSRCSQFFLE